MHKYCWVISNILVLIFATHNWVYSQESIGDLRKDIEALKQGQAAIRQDLQEIKAFFQKLPIPKSNTPVNVRGVEFDLTNIPVIGKSDATFVLVEFTDYQ